MKPTTLSPHGRRTSSVIWVFLLAGFAVGGCSGPDALLPVVPLEPPPKYPLRKVLPPENKPVELSAAHQQQIDSYLTQFFGTPAHPLLRIPSDDEAEGTAALKDLIPPEHLAEGGRIYRRRCAGCHGVYGDGNGPAAAYLNPKPRDYRRGIYKFTSTPYGAKPRRADLKLTIRRGAIGTSMPAFRWLPEEELERLVDYILHVSYRGELEEALLFMAADLDEDESLDEEEVLARLNFIHQRWQQAQRQRVVPLTPEPPYTPETIAKGKLAFFVKGCVKCHGPDGRGHTQANVGKDAWGHTVKAADITSGMLHGGRRPLDIYRRIFSGINGTPMPAFGNQLAQEPETVWHLVHFVIALANQDPIPEVKIPEEVLKQLEADAAAQSQENRPAEGETHP